MPREISVHRADEDERLAAYHHAYESWGDDAPRKEWVERRLESPRHNRADWWVLTDDGEVVSALGCYDLTIQYQNACHDAVGIGAVHTAPDDRRQGHASRLCQKVHDHYAGIGYRFALLFTDIDPDFYRDLGYRMTRDRRFATDQLRELAESGPRAGLHPIDPEDGFEELAVWYDEAHENVSLAIARNREHWSNVVEERPDDRFFGISHTADSPGGYVRIRHDDETLRILELVTPEATSTTEAACYRALADYALARQLDRLSQHFTPPKRLLSYFDDNRRDHAIPMVRPLDDELDIEESWLRQNARFWEGDKF